MSQDGMRGKVCGSYRKLIRAGVAGGTDVHPNLTAMEIGGKIIAPFLLLFLFQIFESEFGIVRLCSEHF